MEVTIPNNWRPRPYQRDLWRYLARGGKRAIEIAHRRWGKDDVALHHAMCAAFRRPGNYWHCLPEYAQGRKAIWQAVNAHTGKRRIDEAFPPELRRKTNDQEMLIEFLNGSTWQVIGSDRYDSTVGAGPVGIVYSEWALCNPSAWAYHRPMVEENDGWAVFITTPRGKNHAYSMYEMARTNPNWFSEISSVTRTGALSQHQKDESLAEYIALYGEDLGRAQYEQEYLCSFTAAILGAFYAREMLRVRERQIEPVDHDANRPVHTAWDIGTRDDTSIWWWQARGSEFVILDCYTASGVGVEHYAEVIRQRAQERGWQAGVDYVPHDARVKEWGTGRTRVESMVEHGLRPELVPMASKLDGVQAVRSVLPRCFFHPRTETGISALENYRREWDDDKKCFRESEVRDWTTHLADAFRYFALAAREQPAPPPPKKPWTPPPGVLIGPPQPERRGRRLV